MPVYIIRSGEDGLVKIGHGVVVERRRRAIEMLTGVPMRLLRTIDGEKRLEMAYHAHFANLRQLGEWFVFSPEMLTVVLDPLPKKLKPPPGPEVVPTPGSLRDLIEKSRKRQDLIAIELGVSAGALSRWLNGHHRLPAVQVRGIARALGVPIITVLAAAERTHLAGNAAGITPPHAMT